MKLKKLITTCSLVIIACLTCVSCVKVNYPYRTQYTLNISSPKPIYRKAPAKTLAVYSVTIVPQFAGLSFAYRTSDINYTKDYYNIFFNPPMQQVEQIIVNYLQKTKLFRHVTDDINFTKPNYVLYARVLELYADYRNSEVPTGVITVKFTVLQPTKKTRIVLSKTFSEIIPLQNKDSQSLVQAWNAGLTSILMRLTVNLRNIR